MRKDLNTGYSNAIGVLIIGIILLIVSATPKDPSRNSAPSFGESGGFASLFGTVTQSRGIASRVSPISGGGSSVSGQSYSSLGISVGVGNASYAYQPSEEYITINNHGSESVNITGWQLRNGKDKRSYYQGNTLQRFSADIALIPSATRILSQTGFDDVILEPGEEAIVTTGFVSVTSPYRVTSFKENMCTGYLENLPDYSFTPPLQRGCPRPYTEEGVDNLERECKDFIKRIPACHTPVFAGRNINGGSCPTCIDGEILSSQCETFIKEHYSYQGCLANHQNNPGFEGRTWRIFLSRGWEMWNKDYESVELYNRMGELQSSQNY